MAEDPLDQDPLDDLEFSSDETSSGGMRRLREAYKREKSRAAELASKLPETEREAEQRGYAKAAREFQARSVFDQVGYPGLAKVWVEQNPEGEPTVEGIGTFLSELGITPKGKEGSPPPPEVTEAAQTFHASTPQVTTPGDKLGRTELRKVYDTNPNEAIRLFNEGKVDLDKK